MIKTFEQFIPEDPFNEEIWDEEERQSEIKRKEERHKRIHDVNLNKDIMMEIIRNLNPINLIKRVDCDQEIIECDSNDHHIKIKKIIS